MSLPKRMYSLKDKQAGLTPADLNKDADKAAKARATHFKKEREANAKPKSKAKRPSRARKAISKKTKNK